MIDAILARLEETFTTRIEHLERQLAAAERRMANMMRVGPVSARDHEKGVRLTLGDDDGEPWLGPWIKSSDQSGVSSFLPPTGMQMVMLSPNGELEQGMALPWTHTDAAPNPAADGEETVFYNRNGVRFSEKAGAMTLEATRFFVKCGGSTFELTGAGLKMVASDYDFG